MVSDGVRGTVERRAVALRTMTTDSFAAPAVPLSAGPGIRDEDVLALLGFLAYTELMSFDRLARTSAEAPQLRQRSVAALHAGAAVDRHAWVLDRIRDLGGDTDATLGACEGVFDDYLRRTEPDGWHEVLLKGYVGDGVAEDLCRVAIRAFEDESRQSVEAAVLGDESGALAMGEIRRAASADPILASRLALWGRRLVGEALGVVQTLLSTRPWLARMIVAGAARDGEGEAAAADPQAWLLARLTAEHTRRMDRLGLAA